MRLVTAGNRVRSNPLSLDARRSVKVEDSVPCDHRSTLKTYQGGDDMQLGMLDHVNIRTANVEEMRRWYVDMLGMTDGWRPPFPFPGAWLYVGEQAFVHLIGIDEEAEVDPDNLKLEHFAFAAKGIDSFATRLDAAGQSYDKRVVPGSGVIQMNVWDPDGNHIHIDFAPEEG
jgi:catechol 2,3-dioxygenase-like lactoylglutathione lyase family enzyme